MKQVNETEVLNGVEVQNQVVNPSAEEAPRSEAAKYIGTKLTHNIGKRMEGDADEDNAMIEKKHLTRIGEKITDSADIRDGWIDVDRRLLGERSKFYPEDWRFRIRPATVEAIRNWSTIDDEVPNTVDDVFNEVLKSCLAIMTSRGPISWGNIRSWDRFFFVLLIREYTFEQGEKKIEFTEECPECETPVVFTLNSQSLMYDLPDPSVMKHYSEEEQTWYIDPAEYDVEWPEPIVLYVPTLERDANIKAWMIDRIQNKKKVNQVFVKFLSWMAPKVSKDLTIAKRQIAEYEMKFKSFDTSMFDFMNEVITNIMVAPSTNLIAECPSCGEEVTARIQFPNGIRDLFNISSGRKKFGKK